LVVAVDESASRRSAWAAGPTAPASDTTSLEEHAGNMFQLALTPDEPS
jgi:hypothetical protein